jgi:hypothetical protein
MSYTGTGVFLINSPGQPVVVGTAITADAFNALTADLASGLTNAMTKDGQSTPTNNITMGGFKLSNVGQATVLGDCLSWGQIGYFSSLTLGAPLAAASGGTGLAAPGLAGNLLVSDGTKWTSSTAGNVTEGRVIAAALLY